MTALTKLTDTYTLNNGTKIPIVGFGTWQTPDGQVAYDSVLAALKAGYRHIDTAAAYGNEESVGKAIADSGVAREDLFVTTKLWNADHGYEAAKKALDTSLEKLGLDYVDLYLIHWPNPAAMRDNWEQLNADTWRAMEEAYTARKARAIGVSNFRPKHLDALLKTAKVVPAVNQIFLNPSDMQDEVVAYNREHGILSEAYSPLGTGKIFSIPELKNLADKYGKSVAQVVLRWSLQHDFLPLPKSVHADRIQQNTELFDFEISDEDMKVIDGFHGVAGLANDPDKVNF
ncbi:aldo/keto reductase [Lactiplantibacillus pentosus]|uniref:aldo/keto reductase n=1 Tax=Lactiplantibacillus pentosus TaxID=1589 RepID=UPI00132FB112|nr:aldo/keto reductase [Lactiplantibacillus pentosus]MBQ0837472.1 aldo/keto reductase [Lactiplantibacillus pentosus]MBU7465168.1 aldo/keto reductase [Lactiplantibacillus pentosus]MBU7491179.1 aldo/keto reductase [Lactiplantibacillus pentosus]MBU7493650.1 aldo/keto reductase [Lactiplantibacillus pentosus]MBU7519754.1 aldo/keto reductase [Lactiplantibacillus pentosus]